MKNPFDLEGDSDDELVSQPASAHVDSVTTSVPSEADKLGATQTVSGLTPTHTGTDAAFPPRVKALLHTADTEPEKPSPRPTVEYDDFLFDHTPEAQPSATNKHRVNEPVEPVTGRKRRKCVPDGYICRRCNIPGHHVKDCDQCGRCGKSHPGGKCPIPPPRYICRLCQQGGHYIEDCSLSLSPATPPPGYICRLCKQEGHFIRDCPISASSGRRRDLGPVPPGYICFNCKQEGHHIHDCPTLGFVPPPGYICRRCKKEGHYIQSCPISAKAARKRGSGPVAPPDYCCPGCRQQGHYVFECPLTASPGQGLGLKPVPAISTNCPWTAAPLPSLRPLNQLPSKDEHSVSDARPVNWDADHPEKTTGLAAAATPEPPPRLGGQSHSPQRSPRQSLHPCSPPPPPPPSAPPPPSNPSASQPGPSATTTSHKRKATTLATAEKVSKKRKDKKAKVLTCTICKVDGHECFSCKRCRVTHAKGACLLPLIRPNYVCKLCNLKGHLTRDCSLAKKPKSPSEEAPKQEAPKQKAPKRIKAPKQKAPRVKFRPECKFWARGSCQHGDKCSFSHDKAPDLGEVVCRFHVAGACLKGTACVYSHDLKLLPCRFYHSSLCERAVCDFSHDPLTESQRVYLDQLENPTEPRVVNTAPKSEPIVTPWASQDDDATIQARPQLDYIPNEGSSTSVDRLPVTDLREIIAKPPVFSPPPPPTPVKTPLSIPPRQTAAASRQPVASSAESHFEQIDPTKSCFS